MPMEPINLEPKSGDYVLSWDDHVAKPPRAPHPVFGPVPRGWIVVTTDGVGEVLVQASRILRIYSQDDKPHKAMTYTDIFMDGDGEEASVACYESMAEVSRLIAEAQGDDR